MMVTPLQIPLISISNAIAFNSVSQLRVYYHAIICFVSHSSEVAMFTYTAGTQCSELLKRLVIIPLNIYTKKAPENCLLEHFPD